MKLAPRSGVEARSARAAAPFARALLPLLVLAVILFPGISSCSPPAPGLCAGAFCPGDTRIDLPDCEASLVPRERPALPKALLPLDAPILQASGAGTLAGHGQVSATGEYQYRIPLDLPAGRAGMQPSLALAYSSREKNDQLGVGWQLEGFSAIRRCPTTFATEGRADGVHLDEFDALCLDGHKLVAIQGAPGAGGTEYRTEDEVFARIVAEADAVADAGADLDKGKGIARFRVWTKEGRIRSYEAINAPASGGRERTPLAWPIAEEADRSGNVVRYSYDVTATADYTGQPSVEYHPSQIEYTLALINGHVADAGQRRIVFTYEERPDPSSVYLGGVRLPSTKRLREIGAYHVPESGPVVLTAQYGITYEQSAGSGRSLLTSVRRCGPEGGCLLSKTFHWQSSAGISFHTIPIEGLPPDGDSPLTLDVDGDGKDEILSSRGYLRFTTDQALPLGHLVLIAPDPSFPGFDEIIFENSLVLDIDGDGIDEILGAIASDDVDKRGYYLFRYNGLSQTFWREAGPPLEPTTSSPSADGPSKEPISLVDLDGDGLVDLVKAEAPDADKHWHWSYRHNQGGSFGPKIPLDMTDTPLQSETTGRTFMFPLDLAGDHRGTLLFSQSLGLSAAEQGYLRGFRLDRNGDPESVWAPANRSFVSSIFGDLNGDGLEDEIAGDFGGIWTDANTGRVDATVLVTEWIDHANIPFDGEVDQLLAGDLDGDGREDILAFHRNALGVDELTVLRLGAAQKLEAIPIGVHARSTLGDFDGDGRLDLAYWANGLFTVDRGMGETFDRITEVYDAFNPHPREAIDYVTEPLPGHGIYAFPQRRIDQSFTVVREHRVYQGGDVVSAGAKERRHVFHYRGPRADAHGRGFLGFSVVEEWDPDRLAETITTYDNVTADQGVYPFAFVPESIQRAVVIDATGTRARLHRIEFKNEIDHLNGGKTYFVHPAAFRSLEWEEDVSVDLEDKAELHLGAIDGADEHTALRVRHGSSTYDEYGNLLSETRRTLHGVESKTVSTYEKRVDDWLIGLLSTQTTTSATSESFPPPLPRHVAYQYEARGLLCHVFLEKDDPDPSLPEVLTYTRDLEGLVSAVTASAVGVPSRTTHFAYELSERVHRSQIWNDLGHAQWFLHDDALGVLLASEDANGVRTQARYDDLTRPIEVVPEGADTVTIDYDPLLGQGASVVGLSVLTRLGSGAKTRTDHDELGRTVGRGHLSFDGSWIEEATRYDLLGRVAFQSRPDFGIPSPIGVTHVHDNLDRLIKESRPGNAVTTFVSTFFETHITDPMGHQRYVARDFDDRLIKSVQIDGASELATTYQYGDFDQVGRITDPLGNSVVSGYDRRGRRWFSDDPDAGTALFTYNGFGDLTSKVINGAAVTIPTYDLLGRVTRIDDDDGVTLTVWDTSPHGLGRVAHTESPDGIIQDFSYDDLARPIAQTWTVDGVSYAMGSSYDPFGRPATLTYPAIPGKAPLTLGRHYTPTGYLDSVFDAQAPENEFWHASARNADGALLAGTLGNGISLFRTYDPETGRLATVDEGPALSLTYDYDFDGQVHHKHDRLVKRRDTFSYDALHRLDGWTLSSVIPGPPGFPEATPTLHETAYVYDPLGNLSTVVRDGALQESNLYGQNGKPHALTHDLQGAYLYDARGRQEHTSKREVTFTEHDLPRTIDTAAGQTRFSYDAAGRRVKKAGPAESLITLAGLYERHVSAGTVRHVFIIEGGEGPVAERSYEEVSGAGSTEYLHRDPLGSVGAVSDQAGALLHARYYEPFGARRDKDGDPAAAPPGDPRLGFAGHVHDEDLGLIDMRGRIYDPALRRFLTPDPHVTDPLSGQSYNRYSYVVNNPINLTDPSGFDFASSSSGGCGFEASCTGSFGTDVGFSFSFGGPGGETGGGSAPDQSSGLNIASSKPKSTIRLPAGTGVSSGARSGPQAQAWSQPSSSDFYNQLRLDLAESIAYNNALWDANTQTRMRRALSTQAQDEDAWRRSGTGGAPSIGYAHDALVYSLNAGHGIGVEQVANAAAVVGMAGAAWKAGQAGFGLLRGLASAQAGADGAAAGVSLNSSNLAMGVERATPELLSAVQRHGRTIQIVAEGSEELRYLNYIGAEANVGGETMAHILLRPDPSKAAVLEEFLHGTQFRLGIVQRLGVQGAETHVKSFMIRHRGMLGLGEADVAALRQLMEAGL